MKQIVIVTFDTRVWLATSDIVSSSITVHISAAVYCSSNILHFMCLNLLVNSLTLLVYHKPGFPADQSNTHNLLICSPSVYEWIPLYGLGGTLCSWQLRDVFPIH